MNALQCGWVDCIAQTLMAGCEASWSGMSSGKWWLSRLRNSTPRHPSVRIKTKAGCETVAHILQVLADLDPDATVVSVDGVGAFDLISRNSMMVGLTRVVDGEQNLSLESPSPLGTGTRRFHRTDEAHLDQFDPLTPLKEVHSGRQCLLWNLASPTGTVEKHPGDQEEQFPPSNLQQIVTKSLPEAHCIQSLAHPRLVCSLHELGHTLHEIPSDFPHLNEVDHVQTLHANLHAMLVYPTERLEWPNWTRPPLVLSR